MTNLSCALLPATLPSPQVLCTIITVEEEKESATLKRTKKNLILKSSFLEYIYVLWKVCFEKCIAEGIIVKSLLLECIVCVLKILLRRSCFEKLVMECISCVLEILL